MLKRFLGKRTHIQHHRVDFRKKHAAAMCATGLQHAISFCRAAPFHWAARVYFFLFMFTWVGLELTLFA